MSFLSSGKINVFPQANRDTSIQATASLLTEDAIAGIVRRASDESYVVSDSFTVTDNKLEFILGGYYFDVDFSGSDVDSSNAYVKAVLTIKLDDGSAHIQTADVGEGPNAVYQGVEFIVSQSMESDSWSGKQSGTDNTLVYYMYILHNNQIPNECKRSYNITQIDCGTLE